MERALVSWDVVSGIEDRALLSELQRLVRVDRALSARLLVHLGEVDARGLYREAACSSMFVYAVERLRMSEAQAYLRIQSARLCRRFPVMVQLVAEGALHLTAIKLIGPHLTQDNHAELLERACGKSKRELEQLVAAVAPKADVPSCMRRLPEPATRVRASLGAAPDSAATPHAASIATVGRERENVRPVATRAPDSVAAPMPSPRAQFALQAPGAASSSTAIAGREHEKGTSIAAPMPSPRAQFALQAPGAASSIAPLSPGRYKVAFTASQAMHDKLEQLKALLRHQVPDGDLALILERAADLLLDKTLTQRCARTHAAMTKPKSTASTPRGRRRRKGQARSRYIPRAVVREVYARDGGCCTFTSSGGTRCNERGFLELHHHDTPFACGGLATVDNLKLLCRAHNALLAERDFGKRFVRATVQHARLQRLRARASSELRPERVFKRDPSSGPGVKHR